jgi:hypothetical protein
MFGSRSLTDVRHVVASRLVRQFGHSTPPDDIDDAVSFALVDLLDYWIHLGSSIDSSNPDATFWRACKRGHWMATQFLVQEFVERRRFIHWDDADAADDMTNEFADPSPSPEEVALTVDELTRLRDFVGSLPESEHSRWLRAYSAGMTEQEQATKEGVSQPAVHYRRARGLVRFARAAHENGLV